MEQNTQERGASVIIKPAICYKFFWSPALQIRMALEGGKGRKLDAGVEWGGGRGQ